MLVFFTFDAVNVNVHLITLSKGEVKVMLIYLNLFEKYINIPDFCL